MCVKSELDKGGKGRGKVMRVCESDRMRLSEWEMEMERERSVQYQM